MKPININKAEYSAILGSAARAYQREDWIGQAIDSEENAGVFIEKKFEPFAERLWAATESDQPEDKVKLMFFRNFTALVLG